MIKLVDLNEIHEHHLAYSQRLRKYSIILLYFNKTFIANYEHLHRARDTRYKAVIPV